MVIDYVPKKQANGTRFTCATKRSERSGRLEAHVGQTSPFPLNMVVNVMLFKCFKNFFTEAHRFFISQ